MLRQAAQSGHHETRRAAAADQLIDDLENACDASTMTWLGWWLRPNRFRAYAMPVVPNKVPTR